MYFALFIQESPSFHICVSRLSLIGTYYTAKMLILGDQPPYNQHIIKILVLALRYKTADAFA